MLTGGFVITKRIAIMQPTYLPWCGYFGLLDYVDQFVFLDNVQYSHRSWQQRNRIKGPSGEILLTVPVVSSSKRGNVNNVLINELLRSERNTVVELRMGPKCEIISE